MTSGDGNHWSFSASSPAREGSTPKSGRSAENGDLVWWPAGLGQGGS